MRRSMRLIAVLLVVGAVGFGASAAMGTTGSSTAGNLSFSVSLPDNATKGQTATYSGSISNTSQVTTAHALVSFNISGPNGFSKNSSLLAVTLKAGRSFSRSGSFLVPADAVAGVYTVTMNVNAGQAGTGSAAAATTVG